jgi:c-di-GMP-binding flagellar brake protein YcgR
LPKRPLIITIIALCYLLSPLAIVTQASMIHHIPIFGPRNIFERLFFTDIIILGIYVLCAVGIFSVKKWGWYVFLSCSLVLIGYNIAVYLTNPRYTLILLIIYNVVLAVVAGIFFRKHIIAPYFNPRLRWWETETRYKIDIYAELSIGRKKLRGEILDISNSGCLIALDHVIKLGTTHTFSLRCLSHFVYVNGRAMRKSSSDEEGDYYGIMFVKLTPLVRESLGALLEELEVGGFRDYAREQIAVRAKTTEDRVISRITETAPRYTVQHTAVLKKEDENIHCQLIDISKHGCFVKTGHDLPQGTMYRLVLRCMKYEAEVNGRIEWKSELDKQHGYGIKFMNLTRGEKKNLSMMIHTLKNIGVKNRLEVARPVGKDVIDKSVTNTPYRIILFFRKLMLKDVE